MEELADKLIKKEEEGARGLADAVALEARLEEANDRSTRCISCISSLTFNHPRLLEISKTLEEKEVELRTFREEWVLFVLANTGALTTRSFEGK